VFLRYKFSGISGLGLSLIETLCSETLRSFADFALPPLALTMTLNLMSTKYMSLEISNSHVQDCFNISKKHLFEIKSKSRLFRIQELVEVVRRPELVSRYCDIFIKTRILHTLHL
jgi:hypothetical protein